MVEQGSQGSRPHPRFGDDLVGLDPDDPEARAFAEHLDRMERCRPAFTVEASLEGFADFAESSNRLGGSRWLFSALIVGLILLGVVVGAWDTLNDLLEWLAR
ncbi:MAG: hypothetical protein ACRDQ7_17060 [Haloechinothrix sp.]